MTHFPCSHGVCYGCAACVDACPTGALSICEGEDTYRYVDVESLKCINCGRCIKVCPRKNSISRDAPKRFLAVVSRNSEIRHRSSSGGAFTELIKTIVDKDCRTNPVYVCGAVMSDDLKVQHKCIQYRNDSDLIPFCKSKYISSDCQGIYNDVDKLISNGNKVIFSGTPCQVAALRLFLGERENIIYIDFACHGVLSQKLFDIYRHAREKEKGIAITKFTFRNKDRLPNGTIYSRSAKIEYLDGSVEYATRYNDAFMALYYNAKSPVRECCYRCGLVGELRCSDITLCDAWGIQEKYSFLNPFEGVSGVCFNTKKGLALAQAFSERVVVYPCEFGDIRSHNTSFSDCNLYGDIPIKERRSLLNGINDGGDIAECVKNYYSVLNLK